MKKTLATLLLTFSVLAASAQVNEVIDSLFGRLEQMGRICSRTQHATCYGREIMYSLNSFANYSPSAANQHTDEVVDAVPSPFAEVVDTICTYLSALSRKADSSRRYETHDAGIDTVMFAISLSGLDNIRRVDSQVDSRMLLIGEPGSAVEFVEFYYMRRGGEDC